MWVLLGNPFRIHLLLSSRKEYSTQYQSNHVVAKHYRQFIIARKDKHYRNTLEQINIAKINKNVINL